MRFSMYALLSTSLCLLSGCKLIAEVSISMNELLDRTEKDITGDLYIEVPRCSDYSDMLIEVKRSIPVIFKGAKYVECLKKDFESLAHFKIPIDLRKNTFDIEESSSINLVFNEENELMIGLPKSLRKEMEQKSRDFAKFLSGEDIKRIGAPEIKCNVTLRNDTGADFKFLGIAMYVNDRYPYTYNEAKSISGNSFVMTLSDVSVKRAMRYGTTTFFRKLD